MSCVAVRRSTGEVEKEGRYADPKRPRLWGEPGDAQWYLSQRYGQGAIADFDIIPYQQWQAAQTKVTVTDVTAEPVVVDESEGLVLKEEGANGDNL